MEADPVTLRVHMKLDKDWQVYFPPENSIVGLFGFKDSEYYVGPKESTYCKYLKCKQHFGTV